MKILDGKDKASIAEAVMLLEKGEIVAFPTETVYGLGAVAYNPYAVAKIFEVKQRPHFDPLIVHLDGPQQARRICREHTARGRKAHQGLLARPAHDDIQEKDLSFPT